jgi:hypothetical protein
MMIFWMPQSYEHFLVDYAPIDLFMYGIVILAILVGLRLVSEMRI